MNALSLTTMGVTARLFSVIAFLLSVSLFFLDHQYMIAVMVGIICSVWLYLISILLLKASDDYRFSKNRLKQMFEIVSRRDVIQKTNLLQEIAIVLKENGPFFLAVVILLYVTDFKESKWVLLYLHISLLVFLLLSWRNAKRNPKVVFNLKTLAEMFAAFAVLYALVFGSWLMGQEYFSFTNFFSTTFLASGTYFLFKGETSPRLKRAEVINKLHFIKMRTLMRCLRNAQKIVISELDADAMRKKAITVLAIITLVFASYNTEHLPGMLALLPDMVEMMTKNTSIVQFEPYYIGYIYVLIYSMLTAINHADLVGPKIKDKGLKLCSQANYILAGALLTMITIALAHSMRNQLDLLVIVAFSLFSSWEIIPRILSTLTVTKLSIIALDDPEVINIFDKPGVDVQAES